MGGCRESGMQRSRNILLYCKDIGVEGCRDEDRKGRRDKDGKGWRDGAVKGCRDEGGQG